MLTEASRQSPGARAERWVLALGRRSRSGAARLLCSLQLFPKWLLLVWASVSLFVKNGQKKYIDPFFLSFREKNVREQKPDSWRRDESPTRVPVGARGVPSMVHVSWFLWNVPTCPVPSGACLAQPRLTGATPPNPQSERPPGRHHPGPVGPSCKLHDPFHSPHCLRTPRQGGPSSVRRLLVGGGPHRSTKSWEVPAQEPGTPQSWVSRPRCAMEPSRPVG